jgi:hypothetical protein
MGIIHAFTSPSKTNLNCIVSGVAAASGTVIVIVILYVKEGKHSEYEKKEKKYY